MKIVNCALLYADGDKYVWSVVTEDADEFPIDMELVADGSVWENDGVKSVLENGAWKKEESGGGGTVVPVITFTPTTEDAPSGTYTSTVPYQEMVNLIMNSPWGGDNHFYPIGMCHPSYPDFIRFNTANNYGDAILVSAGFQNYTFNEDGTYTSRQV